MPDVLGLSKRKVALLIAPYQMRVRFIGSGVAVEQIPAPGDELKIGTPCIVHFAANGLN
jgi:hypothetical protein